MKIKWGALAIDGRGKLGGHVAADGAGGSYLRTKVTPNNPQTMAQAKARSQFGIISQKWNGLTEAQRSAWNKAVDAWKTTDIFGDILKPSGKALYQRVNINLTVAGFSTLVLPASPVPMLNMPITRVSVRTSFGNVIFDGATYSSNYAVLFYSSKYLSFGSSSVNENLVFIDSAADGATHNAKRYNALTRIYGVPSLNDVLIAGIRYILPNGQSSPMQRIKSIVEN